jgi:cobaltochelatase CobN
MRLNNNSVPSLRQSLAEAKGYDYNDLMANMGKLRSDGKTNGDIIKELNQLSIDLVARFHEQEFKEDCIANLTSELLGKNNPNVAQCLTYMSCFLVPKLAATTDELTNTIAACEGQCIPSGPAGYPTRGMADILPTAETFTQSIPEMFPPLLLGKLVSI